jgi:hypothetical protein
MGDLAQIRANLERIRELDEQLEKLKHDEETQRFNQANQIVDYENIELQLLLEEMEQQQEISRRLLEENQELQRKLHADKLKYEKARDDFQAFSQSQRDLLERQKKTLESEQQRQEANSQKEERRLQQSHELLREKNARLTEQKELLQAKLDQLKATLIPRKTRKPKSDLKS